MECSLTWPEMVKKDVVRWYIIYNKILQNPPEEADFRSPCGIGKGGYRRGARVAEGWRRRPSLIPQTRHKHTFKKQ